MPNEPDALVISYFVREKADGATVTIADVKGDPVATLKGPAEPGMNRVQWNMRRGGPAAAPGGRGGGGGGRGGGGPLMPSGDYRVTVSVGSEQQVKIGRIR